MADGALALGGYLQNLMNQGIISPDRVMPGSSPEKTWYIGNDGFVYLPNYYTPQDNQGNATGQSYLGNIARINQSDILTQAQGRRQAGNTAYGSKSDFLHPESGSVVGQGTSDWEDRSAGEWATMALLAAISGGAAMTGAGVIGGAAGAGSGAGAGAGIGAVEAGTMASGVTIGGPMSVGGAAGTALPSMGAMGGMGAGAAGIGAAAGGGGGAAGGIGGAAGGASGAGGVGGGIGGLGGMLPTTAQGWAGLISPAMSAVSGYMQNQAAGDAADAQVNAANNGIAENRRQFDVVRGLLQPYVTAGTGALGAYQGLSGLNGAAAQQAEIAALQGSPQFGFLAKQGEDAILANASATGGIRGGNAQHALADSRTALLTSLIDKQLGRYGGVASMGQSSAVGVGNQAMAMGNNNAQLMQQAGAAQAGGVVAGSNAITNALGGIGGFFAGNNASAPAAGGAMNPAAAATLNPTQFGTGTVPGGYGLTARSF